MIHDPAPRIVNVDDDEPNLRAKSLILEEAGFVVHEARTGASGLELVRSLRPDLVLLDVQLPDMLGFEVARAIRADPALAGIVIVHVSATYQESSHRTQGLDMGADAYLNYPLPPAELLANVRALLRLGRAEADRKVLLERERAARRAAEAATRAQEEFLAIVSHELRTPLSAMLGWARLLNSGQLDLNAQRQAIDTLERSSKLQAQLIEDLLDLSRIITGKLTLELIPVSLTTAVEQAVEMFSDQARRKGVRLDTLLHPGTVVVCADAGRLQQIVGNLLSNAIKFTPPGGHVEVRVDVETDEAVVTIADTGRGIAPEFLPHIFERFRQADTAPTRTAGGLGLGLTIVRHLVDAHHGTVHAASEGEGLGATFTVRLPLIEGEPHRVAPAGHGVDLTGVRVLLVEDDHPSRDVFAHVLRMAGAQVQATSSALEALQALEAATPDAMVADIGMPGVDGLELIKQVRRREGGRGHRLPAAALSAYTRPADMRAALAAGYDEHAAKPIDPDVLVALVGRLAARGRC